MKTLKSNIVSIPTLVNKINELIHYISYLEAKIDGKIEDDLDNILINKPVTTTNEQPKSKCKCAEGFEDLCNNFINDGPLYGCCQLDCINLMG